MHLRLTAALLLCFTAACATGDAPEDASFEPGVTEITVEKSDLALSGVDVAVELIPMQEGESPEDAVRRMFGMEPGSDISVLFHEVSHPPQARPNDPAANPAQPAAGVCNNTCPYANDNVCDDGTAGASFDVCADGTDCNDCSGGQAANPAPASPAPANPAPANPAPAGAPGAGGCSNTCEYANDGVCDDGSPGSSFDVCAQGTDCNDCEGGGAGYLTSAKSAAPGPGQLCRTAAGQGVCQADGACDGTGHSGVCAGGARCCIDEDFNQKLAPAAVVVVGWGIRGAIVAYRAYRAYQAASRVVTTARVVTAAGQALQVGVRTSQASVNLARAGAYLGGRQVAQGVIASAANQYFHERTREGAGTGTATGTATGTGTGRCDPNTHRNLQDRVNYTCKRSGPRSCSAQGLSCGEIQTRISRNAACIDARNAINNHCYGGGDAGHREAVDIAINASQACQAKLATCLP
jgi:hypothetical protein